MARSGNCHNLFARRFGMLLVCAEAPRPAGIKDKSLFWNCVCDCGRIKAIASRSLLNGSSRSCGCNMFSPERNLKISKAKIKHGYAKSKTEGAHRLYRVWHEMKDRCSRQKRKDYYRYGGRGISVCREWLNDFTAFATWAEANGWRKGLQLDRKDNNLGYSADNCRFVTRVVNANNKSGVLQVIFRGEVMTLCDALRNVGEFGSYEQARRRIVKHGVYIIGSGEQLVFIGRKK